MTVYTKDLYRLYPALLLFGGIKMQDVTDLLLSQVQNYNPSDFGSCRVHYDGQAGKGTEWEYHAGGQKFDHRISPIQAVVLSQLQSQMSQVLSQELEEVLEGIPSELIERREGCVEATGSAQVALYDLLVKPK